MSSISAQDLEILSTKAIAAKAAAYCMFLYVFLVFHTNLLGPYSRFRVGACLLTASGEFIVGANVENVSFPVGTCAERVALGTAVVSSILPSSDLIPESLR